MKIQYIEHKFKPETKKKIDQANSIIAEYQADRIQLTLRQLYYQFVARDLIKNNQQEYNKLQSVITNARRAGLIDWDAIIDRTRNLSRLPAWSSPSDIIGACANQYREDLWDGQEHLPIVMVEKDAAIGTVEAVCQELRVSFISNRGYFSDAELHTQAKSLQAMKRKGKNPILLYFGDFDPSGWDMTRDLKERFNMFTEPYRIPIKRLALNPEQIETYDPPPNFAKQTDSRFQSFVDEFGEECYELDAVPPRAVVGLIRDAVLDLRDDALWQEAEAKERQAREQLQELSDRWVEIAETL